MMIESIYAEYIKLNRYKCVNNSENAKKWIFVHVYQ